MIAALQAGIAALEDELAECRADTDRLERQMAEADDAAETLVAHFAAIVADLGLVQLPFRLRLEIEELCQQLGIPRPWVAPR